ncbi:MAG: hypothetical protein K8R24_07670 [Mycobacterium sp.]|nr:hypothetical protein [Mycobacterium sp.]
MSGTTARLAIRVIAGAGLCGAALALSPLASAAPWKTGGYECIEDAAGTVGDPVAAAICAGAPVADMAGIPMALPGPLPAAAAAGAAAAAAVGLPVPLVVPPVPVVVPPVPAVVPPVPVGAAALGVPVPVGAGPLGAPLPVGLPIIDMSGLGGKGVPTGPPPAGGPLPGQPIPPGPTG